MTAAAAARSRIAFASAAVAMVAFFMGNNLPSALYGLFRTVFGYSPLTQTLLYATAIAVIAPGVLLFGPLSDVVGRRRLVAAGLFVFGCGDVLFATAHGTPALFAARAVQGLGMALGTTTAQAALSDASSSIWADSQHAQRVAALTGTLCVSGGLAIGPLVAGILAQYAPGPRTTPFYLHLALTAVAFAVAFTLPGRPSRSVGRWRPARLRVPAALADRFTAYVTCSFLAWAVLGIASAVIPSFLGELLRTDNLALTAGGLATMIGASALAQLAAPRLTPTTTIFAGLSALTIGLAILIAAAFTHNLALAALAMLGCGLGNGLVFAGTLREIIVATPPDERGEVISLVYLINYCGLGIPAVAVGLLSLPYGLLTATRIMAAVIGLLCIVMIAVMARTTGRRSPQTDATSTPARPHQGNANG